MNERWTGLLDEQAEELGAKTASRPLTEIEREASIKARTLADVIEDPDAKNRDSEIKGLRRDLDRLLAYAKKKPVDIQNAAMWAQSADEEILPVYENFCDKGDKLAIIGASKRFKSWFMLQIAASTAAGKPILNGELNPSRSRSVLYVNLEIQSAHMQRRLKAALSALNLRPDDVAQLSIINGRGRSADDIFQEVIEHVTKYKTDVVMFDPLYKLMNGGENAAEDMKPILTRFDELAEETGALVVYVHHDTKGNQSGRNVTDRGSGSGILGRDYDAALVISEHAAGDAYSILTIFPRNYPRRPDLSMQFEYPIYTLVSLPAEYKKALRNGADQPPVSQYTEAIVNLLEREGPLTSGMLLEKVMQNIVHANGRAKSAIKLAEEMGAVASLQLPTFPKSVLKGTPDQIREYRERTVKQE